MAFGSFADILFQWEALGLFDFILPFLLIFAVVFGILSQMKIFNENRGINVIIAIALGLLASRFTLYTDFLNIISPRLGIGLVVILAILLLAGMFTPKGSRGIVGYVLMGVGVVIFIIIIAQTFNILNFGYGLAGFSTGDLAGYILLIVLLIGVIVTVAATSGKKSESKVKDAIEALFGGGE